MMALGLNGASDGDHRVGIGVRELPESHIIGKFGSSCR
jgi:hypothetical protein